MSTNVYDMVTDRIIAQLEQGQIPWNRPWTGVATGAYNTVSNRPYSLLNQMLLKHTSGEYGTFKQWSEKGGKIRKGEKSEIVVFWKITAVETTKEDGTKEIRQIPLLRYYNVFHISQVDGVEPKEANKLTTVEPIAAAEQIKETYKEREHIAINEIISNRAFYSPTSDSITVPCKEQYSMAEEFYSTLFHEMVHSTGHKSRLDRLHLGLDAMFGSETYSKEELVAEIGSASLLNLLGIETEKTFKNSAAYCQSWLKVLKNDNKFIVSAASKAEKAVKYILGEEEETRVSQ